MAKTKSAPTKAHVSVDAQSTDVLDLVRRTSPTNAELKRMTAEEQLRALARCVPVRESTYCISFGLGAKPDYADLTRDQLLAPASTNETTGDLSLRDWVKQRLAMTDHERLAAELQEVGDVV